jgi:sugar lactone lactonase YvrE
LTSLGCGRKRPGFRGIAGITRFPNLIKQIQKTKKPVKSSKKVITIPEKDLFPRGIAYDPLNKNLYISSLYKNKILRIDRKGKVTDFVAENQDGIGRLPVCILTTGSVFSGAGFIRRAE